MRWTRVNLRGEESDNDRMVGCDKGTMSVARVEHDEGRQEEMGMAGEMRARRKGKRSMRRGGWEGWASGAEKAKQGRQEERVR